VQLTSQASCAMALIRMCDQVVGCHEAAANLGAECDALYTLQGMPVQQLCSRPCISYWCGQHMLSSCLA
jgi:hypothetical protein